MSGKSTSFPADFLLYNVEFERRASLPMLLLTLASILPSVSSGSCMTANAVRGALTKAAEPMIFIMALSPFALLKCVMPITAVLHARQAR